MGTLRAEEPVAVALAQAIRGGDLESLQRLLSENPGLAVARIAGSEDCKTGGTSRTLLHVVTDWPGHFPNGAATVAALIQAGAEVNARFSGPHTETPLHWAASSDDLGVLDALLDAGADIEAPGGVIGGGTPLADAVAFGQWQAARRLIERGARTTLWQPAALGLLERVEEYFTAEPSGALPRRPLAHRGQALHHPMKSLMLSGAPATAGSQRRRGISGPGRRAQLDRLR